jgi:transcriptional regulator of acetoin/glycerol metabolism
VILAKGEQITVDDLPERMREPSAIPTHERPVGFLCDIPDEGIGIKDLERELIRKTIDKCQGNKTRAAQLLGVSRKTLYEKLDRYGL